MNQQIQQVTGSEKMIQVQFEKKDGMYINLELTNLRYNSTAPEINIQDTTRISSNIVISFLTPAR